MIKKSIWVIFAIIFTSTWTFSEKRGADSATIGGATGLIVSPNAHIIMDGGFIGLSTGFHAVLKNNSTFTPKGTVTLFKRWETGVTADLQDDSNTDIIVHTKLRFYPWKRDGNTAFAAGFNYQNLDSPEGDTFQIYLVSTFGANILGSPVETTFLIGKSFNDFTRDTDLDFSMGLDISILHKWTKGYLHSITDFANYSYSIQGGVANADASRGLFNTGLRIDALKSFKKLMLMIDVLVIDAMDDNRAFALGATFGIEF